MSNTLLAEILKKHSESYLAVVPFDFNKEGVHIDLSINNAGLEAVVPDDTPGWERFIWDDMKKKGAKVCAGGYLEQRSRYLKSELFTSGDEPRIMHLGIDIWAVPETAISAPLKGVVHSFRENTAYMDYGPTILLQHELDGISFHTLYGHLSRKSLEGKFVGQEIKAGEVFAWLGDAEVNGGWPPHLHFQIIEDMQGLEGDYPGLCSKSDLETYSRNCPDPNLILGYQALKA